MERIRLIFIIYPQLIYARLERRFLISRLMKRGYTRRTLEWIAKGKWSR